MVYARKILFFSLTYSYVGVRFSLDFHLVNLSYPTEAIERYVGEIYIQHNPMVADGKVSGVEILYAY
jgi:predicted SnoaL-like aldol condensation-catalyzing enzyme